MKKRKLVAISGGENGRVLESGMCAPYETKSIDEEIVKLTEKEKPNFLFLVHAQESLEIQESYYQTMKKIYGDNLNCNCQDLKSSELDDILNVKEKVEWADIIYEGGGDTALMIKLWQEKGFDKILFDAWNNGKVICGISAGAACWFTSCNSDVSSNDKNNFSFESVDCLNWIKSHFTPHCTEKGRYESTKEQLRENDLVGIMLSNGCAIEIKNDKYKLIISDVITDVLALKAYWKNNEYFEEKIDLNDKYMPLKELLSKKQDT